MGYSSKIISTFKKRDSTSLREHNSIFDSVSDEQELTVWRPRVVVMMAGTVSLMLIFTSIFLFVAAPTDKWDVPQQPTQPSIHVASAVDHEHRVTSGCTINVDNRVCKVECSDLGWLIGDPPPGHEIAKYLAEKLPDYKDSCTSWTLMVDTCLFPNDILDAQWLNGTSEELPEISELEIKNCGDLSEIEAGAFSVSPALGSALKILTINDNEKLEEIRDGIFDGLDMLEFLAWRENSIVKRVDHDALTPIKNKLTNLEVKGGFKDASVVANLMGKCHKSSYSDLQLVDLTFSASDGMSILSLDMFMALQSVRSLYLFSSGIDALADNQVFMTTMGDLQLLHLNDNQLTTLPNGLFNGATELKIHLQGNKWHCDCHLKWLQDMLLNNDSGVQLGDLWEGTRDNPVCWTPESQRGISLLAVDMMTECNPQPTVKPISIICNTATTTSPATTLVPTTPVPPTESIQCERFNPQKHKSRNSAVSVFSDLILPTRLPNFRLEEVADDGVGNSTSVNAYTGISETSLYKSMRLVWSSSTGGTSCIRNVVGDVVVKNLTRSTAYTFCMMDETDMEVSPNHCLAITTNSPWSTRSWINNGLKLVIITSVSILGLICLIIGAVCVIFAFWKRPTLLTFNKRVVEVKTSRHDAVIMPPPEESIDTESVSSDDPSYVSIKNPSQISLIAFRFREWLRRSRVEELEGTAPTVPSLPIELAISNDSHL